MIKTTIPAVKPFPYSHCHQCGTPYPNAHWPRKCTSCGDMRWHNPTPIGVLLQTVTDGKRIGILTPVRGHGPQLGCEGLTGGFEEATDDGVDDAAMREYREEIHREDDVRREDLDIIRSRGSGPMYPPGKRQSLTFSVNPVPVHVDAFKDWMPDAETTAIEFSWEPRVLAFPTHTLALAAYFRKYHGIEAPAHYFDQPVTGDIAVYEAIGYPIYNVVYEQARLDEGCWTVQLEQDGPYVTVRRDSDEWAVVGSLGEALPLQMPQRDQIEQLKLNWLRNPHWDIEGTEGFEAVADELAAFASVHRARWAQEGEDRLQTRALELGCSLQMARYVMSLEADLAGVRLASGVKGA